MKDRCVAALGGIGAVSRKPIGLLFEDAGIVLIEALVLETRGWLPGVAPEAMRARHTKLG